MTQNKIDKIDLMIIDELKKNGRQSYAEIADKLNISLPTVSRRTDRLIDKNILKIIAITNDNAFQNSISAMITLNVNLGKMDDVCKILIRNPKVSTLMTTYGRYDIFIVVHCLEEKHFIKFIKEELPIIDGIGHIEIFFISCLLKAGDAEIQEFVNE